MKVFNIITVAFALLLVSCDKEASLSSPKSNEIIASMDEFDQNQISVSNTISTKSSCPCSGTGGTELDGLQGSKVLQPGKYYVQFNIGDKPYGDHRIFGFLSLSHIQSPYYKGDLYYRVLKVQSHGWKDDEYVIHHTCTKIARGWSIPQECLGEEATWKCNDVLGYDYVQLEIVVVNKPVKVSWSIYFNRKESYILNNYCNN